jgi:hypothetical protein
MNYRRGLKRIYFALAIPWVLFFLIGAGAFWNSPGDRVWFLELAVIPPLLGWLVLFVVVPWIARGFKSSTNDNATPSLGSGTRKGGDLQEERRR